LAEGDVHHVDRGVKVTMCCEKCERARSRYLETEANAWYVYEQAKMEARDEYDKTKRSAWNEYMAVKWANHPDEDADGVVKG
jgi:cytidylate kinase